MGTYCLVSWLALRRWYHAGARLPLPTILIWLDTIPLMLPVYVTGGTESLLFPVFAIRLGDFNQGNFKRLPLILAHAYVLAYASILAWQAWVDHVRVPWSTEAVKIAVIYFANLFLTMSAGHTQVSGEQDRAVHPASQAVAHVRNARRALGSLVFGVRAALELGEEHVPVVADFVAHRDL